MLITSLIYKIYALSKALELTKNVKTNSESNNNTYSIFDLAATNSCFNILNLHSMFISTLFIYPLIGIDHLEGNSGFKALENVTLFLDASAKVSVGCILNFVGDDYLILTWTISQIVTMATNFI